jgi:methylated-DNA-[protein]-cysteine S-methyltransferase
MPQLSKTYSCYYDSPAGRLLLAAGESGICRVAFHSQENEIADCPDASHPFLVQLKAELKLYFEGTLKKFTVPLELHGTDFRKKVWNTVAEIPYGKTVSYLELSKSMNQPEAIRAVANANAHNPLLIVIPCHRIIGSNGELTGYAGGLPQKRFLLEHEGSLHRNQAVLDFG